MSAYFRGLEYVALVAVLVSVLILTDWSALQRNFADLRIARAMFPDVITVGLRNTVIYTVAGYCLGFAGGLVLALMRMSAVLPYRWLATLYVEIFRGLPALLIFIFVGVGFPLAFPNLQLPGGIIGQAALALGIVSSAYMAESFRAGILAVPRDQVEAALSLGMSHFQTMAFVVIPQAIRIMIPPLTNELVALFKDSALVLFLGVTLDQRELAKFGQDMAGQDGNSTPIIVAAACYLLVTVPLAFLARRLEIRNRRDRKP